MAIRTSGNKFLCEDGKTGYFRGIVDPIVLCHRFNGPNQKGPWLNQMFPGNNSPWAAETTLTCEDEHEYFFKLVYLFQKFKRGIPGEKVLMRWGCHDFWGTRLMYYTWKNNRKRFYEVIDAAIEACAQNDSYLLLTLFGFADSDRVTEFEGLFDPNSAEYPGYVDYLVDVVNHIAGKKGVFGIEVANEPDHEKHVPFWGATKEARMAKYKAWAHRILGDIAARRKGQCLIGIGHALGGTMFDYQWEDGWFLKEPHSSPYCDFCSSHPYWYGAPAADYRYKTQKTLAHWASIGKPGLAGEWGDFRSPPPSGHGYSDFEDWIDDILAEEGMHNTAMRMWPRPGWPLLSTVTPPAPAWSSTVIVTPPVVTPPVITPPVITPPPVSTPVEKEPPVIIAPPPIVLPSEKPPVTTPTTPTKPGGTTVVQPTPAPTPDIISQLAAFIRGLIEAFKKRKK